MKGAPSPGRLGHGSVTGEMELGGEERRAPSPVLRGALPELMPVQEISLILTDEGFAPAKLHVKRGEAYQVTVVNVSGAHRNSSLVIPSLSIYEGIFFATPSTFQIQADHEGLFHFLSPESGTRGELVVYEVPAQGAPSPVGPVEQMHGVEVEAPSPPGLVPLERSSAQFIVKTGSIIPSW